MAYKLIDFERLKAFSESLKTKYATKNDLPKKLSDLKEDTTHRLVTDTEKKNWSNKVSQSQITGDMNATGADKVWNVDFLQKQFGIVGEMLNSKIDKSKIVDTYYANSSDTILSQKAINALMNNFDKAKADKDAIPTKISQLTNDKSFKTETEIQSMIEKASSLKKEVVTSLPTTGKDDVIYLVKDEKGKDNNNYLEYLWLNGKYELIGSTQVDLSEYLKTVNLRNTKLRTNKMNINVFTDRSTSNHELGVILGDLELRTEQNKKNIKTKLSEMTDDSTHRLVTDTEKETWNNKLDKTKDKAEMSSNIDWTSDNTYITPYFFNKELVQRLHTVMEMVKAHLDNKLDKTEDKAVMSDVDAEKGRGKYVDASLLHKVNVELTSKILQFINENCTNEEFTQQELEEAFK